MFCFEVVKHMQNFSGTTTVALLHMVATLTGIYFLVNDEWSIQVFFDLSLNATTSCNIRRSSVAQKLVYINLQVPSFPARSVHVNTLIIRNPEKYCPTT